MSCLKLLRCHHPYRIIILTDLASHLQKLCRSCFQMLRNHVLKNHIAACNGRSKHKGSCFDLVRNNGILGLMERADTCDTDDIRTCAFDSGSHTVQEVGYIYHVGFFCRIFNDGISLCHGSSHHNIDGRTYTDHIQENMRSMEFFCFRNNKSMFNAGCRTHSFKAFQMLIDRTASNVAASRKRDFCSLVFSKKCAKKIIRRTNFFHIFIFNNTVLYTGTIDRHGMTIQTLHTRANVLHCLQKGIDISNVRKIFNPNGFICHICSCKNGKCRILCSADLYFTIKWNSAFNNILFHNYTSNVSLLSIFHIAPNELILFTLYLGYYILPK